jgi:hypothetical protein
MEKQKEQQSPTTKPGPEIQFVLPGRSLATAPEPALQQFIKAVSKLATAVADIRAARKEESDAQAAQGEAISKVGAQVDAMQTSMADIHADIMQMQSEAAAQVAQLCGLVKTLQVLLVESRAQHRETACRLAAAESALAAGEVLGTAARLPAAAATEGREAAPRGMSEGEALAEVPQDARASGGGDGAAEAAADRGGGRGGERGAAEARWHRRGRKRRPRGRLRLRLRF